MTRLTWSPDICDCLFEIKPDFTLVKVLKTCAMHEGLKDKECFESVIKRDKEINLIPKKKGEKDEDHQNRRWEAKEKAMKESKINKKKTKSK